MQPDDYRNEIVFARHTYMNGLSGELIATTRRPMVRL